MTAPHNAGSWDTLSACWSQVLARALDPAQVRSAGFARHAPLIARLRRDAPSAPPLPSALRASAEPYPLRTRGVLGLAVAESALSR